MLLQHSNMHYQLGILPPDLADPQAIENANMEEALRVSKQVSGH